MGLWDMSVSGGIFIVAIIVFRSLFRKRLSGKVFQLLWVAVSYMLLCQVVFGIPDVASRYKSCGAGLGVSASSQAAGVSPAMGAFGSASDLWDYPSGNIAAESFGSRGQWTVTVCAGS